MISKMKRDVLMKHEQFELVFKQLLTAKVKIGKHELTPLFEIEARVVGQLHN